MNESKKPLIIGIHGLANKPKKDELKKWWRESIEEGLKKTCKLNNPNFDFELVYWADLLYSAQQHTDPLMDFDDLYNTEPYVPAQPGALKAYDENWLDDARRMGSRSVSAALGFAKSTFDIDGLADWVLGKFLKDLALYYEPHRKLKGRDGKPEVARKILMSELSDALQSHARGRRCMLIAHSMGSIIAYDVLRDIGRGDNPQDIERFVTIGSPLGLPHVKKNIKKERESYSKIPLRTPSIVKKSWVNFADRSDPVALDMHLSDDYGVNDSAVQVKDDLVLNDYTAPEGDRNHHKSYGYLRTPELSHHIAAFL